MDLYFRKYGDLDIKSVNWNETIYLYVFGNFLTVIKLLTEWRVSWGTRDEKNAGSNPQHHHHLGVQPLPPKWAESILQRVHSQRQWHKGGAQIEPSWLLAANQKLSFWWMDQLIKTQEISFPTNKNINEEIWHKSNSCFHWNCVSGGQIRFLKIYL